MCHACWNGDDDQSPVVVFLLQLLIQLHRVPPSNFPELVVSLISSRRGFLTAGATVRTRGSATNCWNYQILVRHDPASGSSCKSSKNRAWKFQMLARRSRNDLASAPNSSRLSTRKTTRTTRILSEPTPRLVWIPSTPVFLHIWSVCGRTPSHSPRLIPALSHSIGRRKTSL
jgi:hypothetical protein